jgi:hypothetical protein
LELTLAAGVLCARYWTQLERQCFKNASVQLKYKQFMCVCKHKIISSQNDIGMPLNGIIIMMQLQSTSEKISFFIFNMNRRSIINHFENIMLVFSLLPTVLAIYTGFISNKGQWDKNV